MEAPRRLREITANTQSTLARRMRSYSLRVLRRSDARDRCACVQPYESVRLRRFEVAVISASSRSAAAPSASPPYRWATRSCTIVCPVTDIIHAARPEHRARSIRALGLRSHITSTFRPDEHARWCRLVGCSAGLRVRLLRSRMDGTHAHERALHKSQCARSAARSS